MHQDILDLPHEIIDHIYSYCSTPDLVNIASCSKDHYTSVQYLLWSSTTIPKQKMEDKLLGIDILGKLKFSADVSVFKTLYSYSPPYSWVCSSINCNNIIKHCNTSWLRSLEINQLVTDYTLKLISVELGNLQQFKLTYCYNVTCIGWLHMLKLERLKTLTLRSCSIADIDITGFSRLSNLKSLQLIECDQLTDSCMLDIGNLIQLKHLTLSSNRNITTSGLLHVAKLINLIELDLSFSMIDDYIVTCICIIPIRLQKLDISLCSGVTDVGMIQLSKLISLRQLDLQHDCVTRSTLQSFCESTGMMEMNKYCHICDDITLRKK